MTTITEQTHPAIYRLLGGGGPEDFSPIETSIALNPKWDPLLDGMERELFQLSDFDYECLWDDAGVDYVIRDNSLLTSAHALLSEYSEELIHG